MYIYFNCLWLAGVDSNVDGSATASTTSVVIILVSFLLKSSTQSVEITHKGMDNISHVWHFPDMEVVPQVFRPPHQQNFKLITITLLSVSLVNSDRYRNSEILYTELFSRINTNCSIAEIHLTLNVADNALFLLVNKALFSGDKNESILKIT
uniref:Uncharacterized protein n=1 Tax=Glossina pallidipes TaxID=7398 RepID=A0A1A9ZBR0_GLOPL